MRLLGLAVASALVFSFHGYAQEKQTTSDTDSQTNSLTALAIPGVLSAKEISELKSEWTDEKKNKKYMFTASFSQRKPTEPAEKKKYAKSGEIPIRITATLYEVKEVNGKPAYMRQSGSVKFAVLAPDKKALLSKSASLDKMCPS